MVFKDIKNIIIDENELLIVDDWDYLVKVADIYEYYTNHKKVTLHNYFILNFVSATAIDFMPKKYREARLEFLRVN